jgi:hypothetical protein
MKITSYWKCITLEITNEFSLIDNSLQCYNTNDDGEEVTVAQTAAKDQKTSGNQ